MPSKYFPLARLILSLFAALISIVLVVAAIQPLSAARSPQEREVEFKIPKHVPIKVKLKSEKEKAIRDLKNADWHKDFQLEVTNTSDKPIYFLGIWLVLPESINPSGRPDGFSFYFGRMEFVDFDVRPLPTDIPIQPGATYVFEIEDRFQKGWVAHKQRDNPPDPKKLEISLTQLSFGDGTGFVGSDGKPFPI